MTWPPGPGRTWPPPPLMYGRWQSGDLVGDAQHVLIARVRPGHMTRGYLNTQRIDDGSTPFNGSPIFPPLIWNGQNHSCWKGQWSADGPWTTLQEVRSWKWTRSYEDKGTATGTLEVDTIAFVQQAGTLGLYHDIVRGYFSPMRGVTIASRPNVWAQNAWADVLNAAWQIEIWEGYGSGAEVQLLSTLDPATNSYAPASGALTRTWTGLIIDCDLDAHPDMATVTCRDFGILLTDQRLMGWNKDPAMHSPVTFADRNRTQGETKVSAPLTASSGVINGTTWQSQPDPASSDEEWIEIALPPGYYTDCFIWAAYNAMECWVSLYDPVGAVVDSVHPQPPGWIDLGYGTIPAPSGLPWVINIANLAQNPAVRHYLGHGFDLNAGSKIRFTFSNLARSGGNFYAGTNDLAAYQYGSNPNNPPPGTAPVNANEWILVSDASEVVRMIFIWAGFQEWAVDDFGWSLWFPMVFGEAKFFIDVIDDILQQGDFVFYMGSPTIDDRSLGVPHFVYQNAASAFQTPALFEVRDTDLITAPTAKWALDELPHVIRYRGAVTPNGQSLGQDLTLRYMATYYPPWSGQYSPLDSSQVYPSVVSRTAGLLRHFSETMGLTTYSQLNSDAQCLFACVLAAIQYALGMVTGQIQFAGLPYIDLNELVSIVDEGTGINSRLWTATVENEHVLGPQGHWKMTVGGALIDTPEMECLALDYAFAWRAAQAQRAATTGTSGVTTGGTGAPPPPSSAPVVTSPPVIS